MMRPGTMLVAMLVMLTADATAHAKTEQSAGKLGQLDPRTGKSDLIALGPGAAPHGVIVGLDGTALITEGWQNASLPPSVLYDL